MSTPFDDALLLARRAVAAALGAEPPPGDADAAAAAAARLSRFAERAGFDDGDARPPQRPEPPEPPPSSWDRSRDKFLRDVGNLRPRPQAQASGHAEGGEALRRQQDEDKEAGEGYRRTQDREGTRQADREMQRRQHEAGRRARGYGEDEYGRRTADEDFDIDPADADRAARWHNGPEHDLDLWNRLLASGSGPVSPYPERHSRLDNPGRTVNVRRPAAPPTQGSDTDWFVPTDAHAEGGYDHGRFLAELDAAEQAVSLLTARRGRRFDEAEDNLEAYEALDRRSGGDRRRGRPIHDPAMIDAATADGTHSKEGLDAVERDRDMRFGRFTARHVSDPETAARAAAQMRRWGYGQPAVEEFYESSQARKEDGKWTAGANRAGRGGPRGGGDDDDGGGEPGPSGARHRVRDEAPRGRGLGLVGVPPEPQDLSAHVADTVSAALALAQAARDGTLRNADAAAALALSRLGAARKAARDNGLDEVDAVLAELTEEAAGLADAVRAGTNDAEVRDRLRQLAGEADGAVKAAMGGGEEFNEEGEEDVDAEEERGRLMNTMRHFGNMYPQSRDRLRQEAQEDWNRSVSSDTGGGSKDNRRPGYQRQNRQPRTPPPMMDRDLYPRRDSGYAEGEGDDGRRRELARQAREQGDGWMETARLFNRGAGASTTRQGADASKESAKRQARIAESLWRTADNLERGGAYAEGGRLPPERRARMTDDAEHADFMARINDDPKDLEAEGLGIREGKRHAHEYANDARRIRRDIEAGRGPA